jgi:L-malate glycosyltransferase
MILHFSTGKHFRGGERQLLLLHEGLIARGDDSLVICRHGGELARQSRFNVVSIRWRGEWDILGLLNLISVCMKNRPSVMHCHDSHALTHGGIAGWILGIPVIYTRRVVFSLRKGLWSRWKYGRCAAVIAISRAVAAQCAEIVPKNRVHIVHSGVSSNVSAMSRSHARKALGIPEDRFAIGTVGHFTREKNLPLVVMLAKAMEKEFPQVCVACVGPLAIPFGEFPANIFCTGLVHDAANCYAAFDMYVSASTREGLGTALLDAVVRDIPAVGVDAGGTRDIFPDDRPPVRADDANGFIAEVGRMIRNYDAAKKDARDIGARARRMFSVDAMVEGTIMVYRKFFFKKK